MQQQVAASSLRLFKGECAVVDCSCPRLRRQNHRVDEALMRIVVGSVLIPSRMRRSNSARRSVRIAGCSKTM